MINFIETNKTVFQRLVFSSFIIMLILFSILIGIIIYNWLFSTNVFSYFSSWIGRLFACISIFFFIGIYSNKFRSKIGEFLFDEEGIKIGNTKCYLWSNIEGSIIVNYSNYRGEKVRPFSRELFSTGINNITFSYNEKKTKLIFFIDSPTTANELDHIVRGMSKYHNIEYWKKGRKIN